MLGGDHDAFQRARPLIDCYARNVTWMGPSGAGQLTKMVNQICIAGVLQGLAEGLHFAEQAGLDIESVVGEGTAVSILLPAARIAEAKLHLYDV